MSLKSREFYKGIIIRGTSGDISSPVSGEIWHNTSTNLLKAYIQSAVRILITADQTQTLSNKTLDNTTTLTIKDNLLTIQDGGDATKQAQFQASGISAGQTRTFTLPDASTTVVGTDVAQTLSNKTLDNSTVFDAISIIDTNFTIKDDGDNSKQLKFQLSGITTSTTRTLTAPDANTTIVGTDATQTLSNKTLGITNTITVTDSNLTIQDNSDNTKQAKFEASGITTGTTRTFTLPNASTTVVGTDATQTLSNKTLDNSTVLTIKDTNLTIQDDADTSKQVKFQASGVTTSTTRTLTVPDANTTIVGTDATQTLSNKTLGNTNVITVQDTNFTLQDNGDNTKQAKFNVSAIPTGTTRTFNVPDEDTTIVGTDSTQTISNKTIVSSSLTILDTDLTIIDNGDTSKRAKFEASGITTATTRTLTVPNANTTIVGTDVAQTLSSKTMGDALTFTQIATPSNPSSGFNKLYPKSDNKFYLLQSDGTEKAIGSGSGSGGINYIQSTGGQNSDFESNTNGYVAYADAAQATPVDGTGGSPTVTITRTTSTPLRGTGSGLITKDAANRQGQGVSFDFTIDDADKAKVLAISMDYEIASGTYADGDLTGYIYDVTNAVVIQPAGFSILNTGIEAKFIATFQTASNSTSYRYIIHVASTSASAYTFKFDNVSIGPQIVQYGAPISDWVSYTPVFVGLGTPTSVSVLSRRVGGDLEIRGNLTTGTVTGSVASMTLGYNGANSNVAVDTTKIGGTLIVGHGNLDFSSTTYFSLDMLLVASTNLLSFGIQASTRNSATADTGTNIGTGRQIAFYAKVPIAGWSSNVQMSNDTDTRLVAYSGTNSGTQAVTANVTNILFNTQQDTHGAYSSGIYTVKVPGDYVVSFGGANNAAAAARFSAYVNGSASRVLCDSDAASNVACGVQILPDLRAGDTISVRCGSSITLASTCTISIWKVSGPSAIAASESVNLRYSSDAGQSISNNTLSIVNFEDKTYDSHAAVTIGASWKFTAPTPGKYSVKAKILYVNGGGWAAGEEADIYIYKNNALYSSAANLQTATHTTFVKAIIEDDVQMNAGDFIDIRTLQTSGGTIALYTSDAGTHNTVAIHKFD